MDGSPRHISSAAAGNLAPDMTSGRSQRPSNASEIACARRPGGGDDNAGNTREEGEGGGERLGGREGGRKVEGGGVGKRRKR